MLLLTLLGVACSNPVGPNAGPAQLAGNRQMFQTTVGSSYSMRYQNNCFCPTESLQPVKITVRDGVITDIVRTSDGSAVPADNWNAYRTVNQVFDEIGKGFETGARRIDVNYHTRYGYPLNVLVDYQMAADAFVGFQLSDLTPLR